MCEKEDVKMFMPKIDQEKCVSCGECVDVCPADVLKTEESTTTVADPEQCLGCESCVSVCPNEAMTVEEV